MTLIKIIPSPLSKKFNNIDGPIMQYGEVETPEGQRSERSLGEYKRERFPNSTQGERPIAFSISKRRYNIKDYTVNSEELNELVKRCNLINDIPSHFAFNKKIEECDIFNIKDPFFNHKSLRLILNEGYGSLDTDNPLDLILYKGVLVNNKYQVGGETSNTALSGRAKYIIVDSSIDKDAKKNARAIRKEAELLIDNMTDEKKRSLALAMGLITSEDTDIDLINDIFDEYALNPKKQQSFIKFAKSSNEELETRSYINKGFRGLIKKDRETNTFTLFGIQIGKDKQAVVTYLLNPINNEILYRLKKAIDLNTED